MQFIHHLFISAFMVASKVICDDTDSGSYLAHYALPAPSFGPFAHPKPSTNNIPTAIPSLEPGTPVSPSSTTSSVLADKSSRRSSADTYPVPPESQLPTPPSSHSNVPSPVDAMSPATPPNYEGDTAKIVSSAGSNLMQISGDNISPPYHHHVHTRKSSSPIPAHPKSQIAPDTKHTSPMNMSNVHLTPLQHRRVGLLVIRLLYVPLILPWCPCIANYLFF